MSDDQLEQVLDPAFLDHLQDRTAAELRAMRDRCEEEENRVSYARRILQGRVDLVRAEAMRRERGTLADEILEALPDVLSDRGARAANPAQVRLPRRLVPPELDDMPLDESGTLDLGGRSDEELRELAARLAEHERELSRLRRQLFDVIDKLQAELADRYRSGAASVSELLSGD